MAVCDDQLASLPDVPARCLEPPRSTKEHNKIGSAWLENGSCLEAGPSRKTEADKPLMGAAKWTAPPTPRESKSCSPGWALDGSLVAAPSLSGVMIGWWRWRRPTLSASMTRLSAPSRELLWPQNSGPAHHGLAFRMMVTAPAKGARVAFSSTLRIASVLLARAPATP